MIHLPLAAATSGLSAGAHLVIAALSVTAIVFVVISVRHRRLMGKYALLWIAIAIALGVLAAFPGLLTWISLAVGILYPPTLFLLLATAFLFLMVVQFSWEISRLHEQTRTLAEEVALLRCRLSSIGNDTPPERGTDQMTGPH